MSRDASSSKPAPTRWKQALYAAMSSTFGRNGTARSPSNGASGTGSVAEKASVAGGTAETPGNSWSILEPLDGQADCLAVVVHAFYTDVFQDIVEYLSALGGPIRLYVTAPPEAQAVVETRLASSPHPYTLMACKNLGRDVLPFLKIVPTVIENGHKHFLKVHTKKSPHRWYGDFWRRDMYANLMSPEAVVAARRILGDEPHVGIIAPKNHLVPMTLYSKANEDRIFRLSERLGVSKEKALRLRFPAGTMFFGRTESILPLLDLSLEEDDFELESGQVDGTLAHAMERLFAVAAEAVSLETVDTGFARKTTPVSR